jgi:hypothetical protein
MPMMISLPMAEMISLLRKGNQWLRQANVKTPYEIS